jgi:hypothetical protein
MAFYPFFDHSGELRLVHELAQPLVVWVLGLTNPITYTMV